MTQVQGERVDREGERNERPRISARVAGVAPSQTLAVDQKAKALQAQGEHVIGFGAGEPDFPSPPHVVEAAVAAARDPRNHRYTPTAGLPELRAAIARSTAALSGREVEPAQVVVTNGGKHAVATAFACLLDPGDEVLLPAPYWTTYPEAIRLAGGVARSVFAGPEQGFKVTVEDLERAVSPATKAVVFVSPSNPTGAVYSREEMAAIGQWMAERELWVVCDEIYERLVYPPAEQFSLVSVVPELAERAIVLNGVAKSYAMTGWRVGWLIGPTDVAQAAINLLSHETSNVANVAQRAALAAIDGPDDVVSEMRAAFDRRRRAMVAALQAMPGVVCPVPEGAFYAFPDLRRLLGRRSRSGVATTTMELAALVLDEVKVAFVPGEAFGAPGYGRFSYALADDALAEGMARLAEFVTTLA
jgi:aspartate aminotransferase